MPDLIATILLLASSNAHARGGTCGSSGICSVIGSMILVFLIAIGILSVWSKQKKYSECFPPKTTNTQDSIPRGNGSYANISPKAAKYFDAIKKHGTPPSEIAAYLCRTHSLDIAKVRARGYSNEEIIAKLGGV